MAMHARPVPADPYNPMPPTTSLKADNDTIRHPSPFVPIRIPIFALVIWINDIVVKILNIIGGRPIVRHKGAVRSRAFSDPNESAEDGTVQIEMKAFANSTSFSSSSSTTKTPKGVRATSGRVKLGARPKLD